MITDAIDRHIKDQDDDGTSGILVPARNGPTRSTSLIKDQNPGSESIGWPGLTLVERVTGIEPALSAWESVTDLGALSWEHRAQVTVSRIPVRLRE
ncbi:hypothetical protein Aph01nite_64640 [Acrocarpospora phusangensis]|uniref:Uncharacterized protein n=1 Tax=Acrocarpospora phusangensis TaxID=1070424 RepID=A0A919QFE7_9ACTN|nr:hypothetical protein Aph01nite_64640 [Acrocarpospora phusangensis]